MSLHYFIDGYNLIRSSDWLGAGGLDAQRERLIRFLEEARPTGHRTNRVTIVFDGKPGRVTPRSRSGITVCFSYEKDADTVIKQSVDSLPNPRNAVVVTNDKAIQRWVRGAHATVLSCGEFLSVKSPRHQKMDNKRMDPTIARTITSELENVWIKKAPRHRK